MENTKRNRNITLSVRLTDLEKAMIKAGARERSLSLTDYIIAVLLDDEEQSNKIYADIMKRLRVVTKMLETVSKDLKESKEMSIDFEDIKDMQVEIKALVIEMSAAQ